MNYTVSIGDDYTEISVPLSSVTTSGLSIGDIISNDKFNIAECLTSRGGSATLKEVQLIETKTAGSLQSASNVLVLFKNQVTKALGISSGAPFVLDGTNNTALDVAGVLSFSTYVAVDANTTISTLYPNMKIESNDATSYSLSGALKTLGTPTYDTHTLRLVFKFARD
jgi:hypothetical protein